MRELGIFILVCGFLIFAMNVLSYIGTTYGCTVFFVGLSILFMFVGTVLIFICKGR